MVGVAEDVLPEEAEEEQVPAATADAVEEEVGVRREAVEALLDVAAVEDAVRLLSP